MNKLTNDLIRKAFKNDVNAQYEVGLWFYREGTFNSAIYWLERAALQGHSDAKALIKQITTAKES